MLTYLLTWNPQRWNWTDLDECILELREVGYHSTRWSCGNTKKIMEGDRVFLLRQGDEPRGIFASGWAASTSYPDTHWADDNKQAWYIEVDLDVLLNPESENILFRSQLDIDTLANMHWNAQSSGVQIPDEVATNLEIIWSQFLTEKEIIQLGYVPSAVLLSEELTNSACYFEGTSKQITTNVYERNPKARSASIQHYGTNCCICDFNFEAEYGLIGQGFIHVHHQKPLAEIGENYMVNAINDLCPVCPNCHAMLHKRNPPYTIEEMREIRERARKMR
jgi:5-methylcytosine-specific restriction enzyme A